MAEKLILHNLPTDNTYKKEKGQTVEGIWSLKELNCTALDEIHIYMVLPVTGTLCLGGGRWLEGKQKATVLELSLGNQGS